MDYLGVRETESLELHAEVASTLGTDAAVERRELRYRLLAALSQLSIVQREVVLLHDLDGLRHAEIAVRLELTILMSRRHLSDARKALRDILGDYATLEPDHE